MKRLKPIDRGICDWVKKHEPDYGNERGEIYYEHIDTKETVWDRPEDYWSEGEEEVDLDDEENSQLFEDLRHVASLLRQRSLSKSKLQSKDIEKISDALAFLMRCTGQSLGEVFENWLTVLAKNKPSGIFLLAEYFHLETDNLLFLFNALNLAHTFAEELAPACWKEVSIVWRFSDTIQSLTRAYPHAVVKMDWLSCTYNYLSYSIDQTSDLDQDPNDESIDKFILIFVENLLLDDEEIFLLNCKCLIALLGLFSTDDGVAIFERLTTKEQFSNDHKVAFKEAFLTILNSVSTLESNQLLQHQVLECGKVLIASDIRLKGDVHDGVFNVQDTNIITDICLLSINNLEPQDIARCDFLKLISLTISTTAWQRDLHKFDDIRECLHTILDPKHDTFLPSAIDLAEKSLEVLGVLDD